jgi:hypothetical protein
MPRIALTAYSNRSIFGWSRSFLGRWSCSTEIVFNALAEPHRTRPRSRSGPFQNFWSACRPLKGFRAEVGSIISAARVGARPLRTDLQENHRDESGFPQPFRSQLGLSILGQTTLQ